jgi:membrane protein required for colicin V production
MAWQLASLAALVVSYFASLKFGEQLAPLFGQQAPLNKFVAMFAIYVGTSLIIWTMFRLISGIIDKVKLETFDQQLGAMFGFAKGVLLCVGITFFAVTFFPGQAEAIIGSQSGHYIVALLDKAHSVCPPEFHQVVDPYLNKIEQRLNPNFQPHGQDVQAGWPTQPAGSWSQAASPQPAAPQQQPPAQFGWPTNTQQPPAQQSNPYGESREPNPFPSPYSAQVPSGRDY